jgi:hypothetical protein
MGSLAVPLLTAALGHEDERVRDSAAPALGQASLFRVQALAEAIARVGGPSKTPPR